MASERRTSTRSTHSIPRFVSRGGENSQRSFHACDIAQRRHLYLFRPGRFSVILPPRMILTRLARLGEQWHSDAVFGSIIHFTLSGQRFGKLSVSWTLP